MGALIAGLAVAAVGTGVSAYGSSKNAKAVAAQAKKNAKIETQFAADQQGKLDAYIADKQNKLYNSGDLFDRYYSTGAFGSNTSTLDNLRKAQSDFSALAAGDTSGFENQLKQIIGDIGVQTFGAGAPVGTYAGLSANALLNLRLTGLQQAQGITGFLSDLTSSNLNAEFGILDQQFQNQYMIQRNKTNAITQAGTAAAQTQGITESAIGGGLQGIGSSLATLGMSNYGSLFGGSAQAAQGYLTGGGNVMAPTRTATDRPPSSYFNSGGVAYPSTTTQAPIEAAAYSAIPTGYGELPNPSLGSFGDVSLLPNRSGTYDPLPASNQFDAYNSLLLGSSAANRYSSLPYVGKAFAALSSTGYNIASGMQF